MPEATRYIYAAQKLSTDLPIRVSRHRECGSPLHCHDFIELVLVSHGRGRHLIAETSHPITAGDAFVIPADTAHGYADTDQLDIVNILIGSQLAQELVSRELSELAGLRAFFDLEPRARADGNCAPQLHLSSDRYRHIDGTIDELICELGTRPSGYRGTARALLVILIGRLARWYEEPQRANARQFLKLANILRYIDEHAHEVISIDDLCSVGGTSSRTLLRSFRKALGTTPRRYMLQLRLDRARDLLHDDRLTITSVALRTGFCDHSHLTNAFQKRFGLTPKRYRQIQCR